MTEASAYLPRQDALYLRRERDGLPMHFVMMGRAAPGPGGATLTLDAVRDHVAARLPHLPELWRTVRLPPFGIGRPVWHDDPTFDPRRHVVAWDTDDPAALGALTARRVPLGKPLWELHVSRPLADGSVLLGLAVHHALMDGGLLVGVLRELYGPAPDEPAPDVEPLRPPGPARVFAAGVVEGVRHRLRPGPPPAAPAVLDRERGHGTLAGPIGPRRAVGFVSLDFSELRRARQAIGATVNDCYLAAVTSGLRALLASRGLEVAELLALVPRDVRPADAARAVGNRTWTMLVPLPVGLASAAGRLAAIRAATADAKSRERSAGVAGFRYDLALTNVALGGPHTVAGHAITGYRGTGPHQGENRLLAVALSYGEEFSVTYAADADAFPDLELLASETQRAFDELAALPVDP